MSQILDITQDQVDLHLSRALKTVTESSKPAIAEAAQTILNTKIKALREVRSGSTDVLRIIRDLACLGYHYALFRGKANGNSSNLPSSGVDPSSSEVSGGSVDSGLVSSRTPAKRIDIVEHATLFDDESTKEKLKVMSKWDAMFDDARNTPTVSMDERADEFLESGKTYKITVSIEEVDSGTPNR